MALKLNERYPGRFNNHSTDYPQGSFKNRTTPTAKDGSYLEKDWANDKEGFFQSLIAAAGVVPSGAVDKVGASQYFDSLKNIIASTAAGRLIGTQVFTANGTYTPTPGTKSVVVEVQAGGGGGGASNTTIASQTSVGTAAHGGGYAQSRLTSGFAGASVVVGAGGTGGTAGNNNATVGGSSSFGALLSATGGGQGALGIIQTTGALTNSITAPGTGTGGNIRNMAGGAAPSTISVALTSYSATQSGTAMLGGAVSPKSSNGPGVSNTGGYGGGGGGAISSNSAGSAGGAGAPGIVIVWEYA